MDLEKLRARLGAIRVDQEAILSSAESTESGALTAEQAAQFDALSAEFDGVTATIVRGEKMAATAAAIEAPRPRTVPALSGARVADNIEQDATRGFRNIADFALAVRGAGNRADPAFDERLRVLGAPTNFHRETGSADGYMVPPAMRADIWSHVFADEGLISLIGPEPTDSNQVQLLRDESTPWGATGIQANWSAEGAQLTASRLATAASNVTLHKLHAFVLASEELLVDAPRLSQRLTVGAANAIRYEAEQAFVNGDGVGKPLGWMSGGSLVTVAKESGQAADTVVAANVAKMLSRILLTAGGSPVWLINQDVLPQLMTMTLGDQPIWTPPSTGFVGAPGGFLFGRAIRFCEQCDTLGDLGDIQLVDPKGYYAATRGGAEFASSMHLYFDYDVQAFRWTTRFGGQPYLTAAVTPANSAATRSHFVVLAERA